MRRFRTLRAIAVTFLSGWLVLGFIAKQLHPQNAPYSFVSIGGTLRLLWNYPFETMQALRIGGLRLVDSSSSWSGSDLGAKAASALADCTTPCLVLVTVPGTISTSPPVPRGYKLEFEPGAYTLSTHFLVNHRSTTYEFNNAQFNYTLDDGDFAFRFGKASAYAAQTCSVTNGSAVVTWVSGPTFADVDAGDTFYALNQAGNILSVQSTTQLTMTAVWPGATNANTSCVEYLSPDTIIDNGFQSVVFRNLLVNYAGAGTQNNTAFGFKVMSSPWLQNVRVGNWNKGTGYSFVGTITADFYSVSCGNVWNCQIIDGATFGGYNFTSNNNIFWRMRADNYDGVNGNACNQVLVKQQSTGNSWYGADFEYNKCTEIVRIQDSAVGNGFYAGCRFEGNGDATANSRDIRLAGTATNTIVNSCYHTSGVTNTPNTGIQADATTVGTTLENERFNVAAGSPYATCYNFVAGASGRAINVGCPTAVVNPGTGLGAVEDQTGNYTVNTLIVQSASGSAVSTPNGGIRAGGFLSSASGYAVNSAGTVMMMSPTPPTISSGFGTSPSIVFANGSATFEVNVGTGGVATSGVLSMPAASNGWSCQFTDLNTNIVSRETAFTTGSVTITAASAWTASDKLMATCFAF